MLPLQCPLAYIVQVTWKVTIPDDANSSINQHKFNEISMLDIPTCSLDLNTPILSHVSDTGVANTCSISNTCSI